MKTVYIVVYKQDHTLLRGKKLEVTANGLLLTKADGTCSLIDPFTVHSIEIEENPLA